MGRRSQNSFCQYDVQAEVSTGARCSTTVVDRCNIATSCPEESSRYHVGVNKLSQMCSICANVDAEHFVV